MRVELKTSTFYTGGTTYVYVDLRQYGTRRVDPRVELDKILTAHGYERINHWVNLYGRDILQCTTFRRVDNADRTLREAD